MHRLELFRKWNGQFYGEYSLLAGELAGFDLASEVGWDGDDFARI